VKVPTAALLAVLLLAGCTGPTPEERAAERAQMKEELRRELLAELRREPGDAGSPASAPAAAGGGPAANAAASAPDPATLGAAEGRILADGRGVEGCTVQLTRLVESKSLLEAFKTFQEGASFSAVTASDGGFRFDALPAGAYSVRWLPKGETAWIRRLNDRPDLTVQAAAVAHLPAVDLARITIVEK
jgi:hypothetical protein